MEKNKNFPPGTFEMEAETNRKSSEHYAKETSGSVESLINHNQDLASRLNVAISRNIDLEKTLSRFKKVHSQYESRFQSVKDQISLHKEKQKFLQNENQTLKKKIQTAQAYIHHERKEFEEEKKTLSTEISSLKPQAEEYIKLKRLVETDYLPERDLLRESLSEKNTEIDRFEMERKELLKKLGEASDHIQTLAHDFKRKSEELDFKHKNEIKELTTKFENVQSENLVLADRNRILRKEQIEKTELLNRVAEIKKEKELNLTQFKEDKEDLLHQISKSKKEIDRLKIENHSLKKQWAKTQSEFRSYKSKTQDESSEAESLRALWQEKSSDFSALALQNESLQKQSDSLERKISKVAEMHEQTKQRVNFFFSQLDKIKGKQDAKNLAATEAMEKAFKKAIEPFIDFDENL